MSAYTINTTKKLPYLYTGIGFTIPVGGKKSHLAFIDNYGEVSPACGSGSNISGRTLRKPSRFKLDINKEIEGDSLCSKCLKNDYLKELKV